MNWLGGMLLLIGLGATLSGLSLGPEFGWWEPRKEFLLFGIWPQPFTLSIAPVLMIAGGVVLALSLPAPAVVAADKLIRLRRQRQAQPELGLAGSAAPASAGEFSGSTA